ncbi:hypothetical protein AeNC1_019476, partial [Aphanomyces euteiches]
IWTSETATFVANHFSTGASTQRQRVDTSSAFNDLGCEVGAKIVPEKQDFWNATEIELFHQALGLP